MKKRRRRPRKRLNTLDKFLIFCLAFAVIYTIAEQTRLWLTGGMEASSLSSGVFQLCTGEAFACVLLYRFKIKKRED